jgi:hypothetical protein
MIIVNPIQTKTYDLSSEFNSLTFGSLTALTCNCVGGAAVDGNSSAVWDIVNQGFVSNMGARGDGFVLTAGSIGNLAAATIQGAYDAVYIAGSGAGLTNAGMISGEHGAVLGLSS